MENEEDLYDHLKDSLLAFAYKHVLNDLKIETITEEQNEAIKEFDFSDTNEELENIIEHVDNVLLKENLKKGMKN